MEDVRLCDQITSGFFCALGRGGGSTFSHRLIRFGGIERMLKRLPKPIGIGKVEGAGILGDLQSDQSHMWRDRRVAQPLHDGFATLVGLDDDEYFTYIGQ